MKILEIRMFFGRDVGFPAPAILTVHVCIYDVGWSQRSLEGPVVRCYFPSIFLACVLLEAWVEELLVSSGATATCASRFRERMMTH